MSRTAMKLALEALEVATTPLAKDRQEVLRAQAALREALAEQPAQQCRTDGRCQYAIDSGAEGMGHCPKGKCVMPAQRKPLTSQERDAQRWRFLMENSYDSESVTQFHVWEHSWEPHSKTGEPTEWKQRVRGIALIDFIDRAIEAKLKEKNT